MIKYLLFLIFVLHHINGQNQITFIMNCLTPEECQMSLETLSEKFEKCGGTKEAPKYKCPRESVCNCKPIHDCEKLNELVVSHKFNELKTNYKSCGFDRKVPKYCCPSSQEKITTITNFELSEDPKPQATARSLASKAPKQIALSPFQRAILKNSGVKNIPDTIVKVQRPKISEPKVVQFLVEEPINNWKPQVGERYFGPFEVFQPYILKNAEVTNIIDKVEKSDANEPRAVRFLAE